ncbi:MAG: hypothetical protein IJY12_03625, partial [Clostridia bacterium]|nr:hypothetical protein [Clostridia bacterium]
KTAKCDNCDATDTVADVGSAKGHSFTEYETNGDAACTKDGTKTAKCDNCDATDTVADAGSAKGHTYEKGECTVCGAEDPDHTNLTWVWVTVPSVAVVGGLAGWIIWRKKKLIG